MSNSKFSFHWTDERCDELRHMADNNYSAAMIANHFGISRNAVIGKCKRMRIPLRYRIPAAKPKPETKRRIKLPPPKQWLAPAPKPKPTSVNPRRLLELHYGRCRYPLWKDGTCPEVYESRYCGDPIVLGSSYCATHTKLCYQL